MCVCVDRFAGQGEKAGLDILLGPGKQRQERSRSFDHCWGIYDAKGQGSVLLALGRGPVFLQQYLGVRSARKPGQQNSSH